MMRRAAFFLVGLVLCGLISSSHGQEKPKPDKITIKVTPKYPIVEQEAEIEVLKGSKPAAGQSIRVVYRPNSEVEHKAVIGSVDKGGKLKWTPEAEGIVSIQAILPPHGQAEPEVIASKDCAVRFQGMPIPGVIVFSIAFLILFGGMVYSLLRGM